MWRRIAAALGMLLAVLCGAAAASAAPVVSFKAAAVPIRGFPNTGNLFGAGEAVEVEYEIAGSDYGGFPPPLIHFDLRLPAGVKLDAGGFPTCPLPTLEPPAMGPKLCAGAKAGPTGTVDGYVAFGREVVAETATIEPFYGSGDRLEFFVFGHEPVPLEVLSVARVAPDDGEFGQVLEAAMPLVETVPGAQDASFKLLRFRFGSAFENDGEPTYYLRAPSACPRGYLPYKAELTFAGLGGLSEQTVTREYRAACPRRGEAEAAPSPLPGTEGVVTAPSNKTCVSKRDFRIHIVHIPHLVYRLVTVEVNGKPVKVLRGRRQSAQIDLRGLPKGRYVARIGVVTTSGRLITGTRTYRTCAKRPIHPKRPPRL